MSDTRFDRLPTSSAAGAGAVLHERVEFEALCGGEAPLTWGQLSILRPMQWYGEDDHYFNISRVIGLPGDCTMPALLAAVGGLVQTQQSLRNRFCYRDGELRQWVVDRGTVDIAIHRHLEGSAKRAAHEITDRLCAARFAITTEWPVRMAAVTVDGRPAYFVLVASHLAMDGWAVARFADRLVTVLREPPEQAGEREAWGTLQQAAYEQSPAARDISDGALASWRRQLGTIPTKMFDRPRAEPTEVRYHRLDLDSRAVAFAAQLVADRAKTSTSAVLLAATGFALAELADQDTWVLQLIAGNRHEPRRRHTFDAAAQDGLFVLTPSGGDLDSLLRMTYRVATLAYSRAFYDPVALAETIAEVSRERGTDLELTTYFNDARGGRDRWSGIDYADVTPDRLRRLHGETATRWSGTWRRHDCHFFMHVHYLPDRCRLRLLADTAFIPRPMMAAALYGIENLLVEAAGSNLDVADAPDLIGLRRFGAHPEGGYESE